MIEFADHNTLRLWRTARRLTQARAATVLGVSPSTYVRWEAGRYPRDLSQRLHALKQAERTARGKRLFFLPDGVPIDEDAARKALLPLVYELRSSWREEGVLEEVEHPRKMLVPKHVTRGTDRNQIFQRHDLPLLDPAVVGWWQPGMGDE